MKQLSKMAHPRKVERKRRESWQLGFAGGVLRKLEDQEKANQEISTALVRTSKDLDKWMDENIDGTSPEQKNSRDSLAFANGYREGYRQSFGTNQLK